MQIEITQQEAAALLNFINEYDFVADPVEGAVILGVVTKLKPIQQGQ